MASDSAIQVGQDVASTMANMSKALESSRKQVLREIGQDARKKLLANATQVPGGDRKFSRMNRYNHGGRLAVTYSVREDLVFIGSKGPWKIAEEGAAPHRQGKGRHPGTARSQGRKSWTLGADPIIEAAEQQVPEVIGDAVEEAFDRG